MSQTATRQHYCRPVEEFHGASRDFVPWYTSVACKKTPKSRRLRAPSQLI
jgi:hypothetical protein